MTQNIFRRLRDLVPLPPVLVGKVLAHHDDDTSTVEIPAGLALSAYGGNVATGALIRPRKRTVPVGSWAFVRAGVIENEAPPQAPVPLQAGQVVYLAPPAVPWLLDTFTGAANTDLLNHVSDSGHAWLDDQFNTYVNGSSQFLLDGAGHLTSNGPLAYLQTSFLPPPGVAWWIEWDVIYTNDPGPGGQGMGAQVYLVDNYGTSYGVKGAFEVLGPNNPNTDLLLVNCELQPNASEQAFAYELTTLDPYVFHTVRLEASADWRSWTTKIDGALYGGGSAGAANPMVVATPVPLQKIFLQFRHPSSTGGTIVLSRIEAGPL
jgi:hypothetical protein